MSKTRVYAGQTHEFPDDLSDAEIDEALKAYTPTRPAAPEPSPAAAVGPQRPNVISQGYQQTIGPAIREGYRQYVGEPVTRGVKKAFDVAGQLDVASGIKTPEEAERRATFYSGLVPQNVPQLLAGIGTAAGAFSGPVGAVGGGALGGVLGAAIEGRPVEETLLEGAAGGAGAASGEIVGRGIVPAVARGVSGAKERIANLASRKLGGEIETATGVPINPAGPIGPTSAQEVAKSSVRLRDAASGELMEKAQALRQKSVDQIEDILTSSTGPHARIQVPGQTPGLYPGSYNVSATGAGGTPTTFTTPSLLVEGKDMTLREASDRLSEIGNKAFDPYLTAAERTFDGKDARQLYGEVREQIRSGLGRHPLAQRIWETSQGQYERSRAWSDLLRGQVEGHNVGQVFQVPRNRLAEGWGTVLDAPARLLRGIGGSPGAISTPVRAVLPDVGGQYAIEPNAMLNMGTLQNFLQQPVGKGWAVERFGQEGYDSLMKVLLPGRQPFSPSGSTQGMVNVLSQQILSEFTPQEVVTSLSGRQRIPRE